jgi:surfeit locus 1 family protein
MTLLLIILLTVFISAGLWQLGRAGEKHDLNAAFNAGSIVKTLNEPVSDTDAAEYRFRLIELSGRYDPRHQFLLDNIVSEGRNGYHILTPFITDEQTTLMVNRGWLAANADRNILPAINVDGELRTITARINQLPAAGIKLEAPVEKTPKWPQRMLYPTRDQIVAALDTQVPDYQLLLDADQANGYLRDWKAVPVGPEKHYGYAFQWFSFAVVTLVFYIILNVRWTRQHKKSFLTVNPHE